MKCPKWLVNEYARKFWQDHAKHLIEDGALNERNVDLFGLLCEVWGEIRTVDKQDVKGRIYFIALLKQFQTLTKQFRTAEATPDIASIIREGMDNAE
jgi:phage terminase small subunit